VVAGNRFGADSVSKELEDAARVRASLFPAAPLTGEALLESLNVEPQSGPAGPTGIVVLDWGTWAAAAQRHLMMAINAYDTHLETMLGLPEKAAGFRASLRTSLSSLRLFPLVAISLSGTPEENRGALLEAARLARTRPELLSDWMWKCLIMKEPTAPASTTWFAPFFPFGTLYDSDHRPFAPHGRPRFRPDQIADFRTEAPYSHTLAEEATRALGPSPSATALAAVYGEMVNYDGDFAERVANTFWDDATEYARRMEALTAMDIDAREVLAEYFVDRGKVAEAVRHYERWLAETQDDLSVASSVEWLVRHYYETGEQAKATAVAERAAGTYAYGGLLVRARLHEWRGEPGEAERLLVAANRRYGSREVSNAPLDLLGFYLGHGWNGPAVDRVMAVVFPTGMKRVTATGLTGTPGAGVRITYTGETGKKNGLAIGDVVVAVDGVEVRDLRQYRVARGLAQEPVLRMTVWRAGRYLEVHARVRFGWVYGRLEDYRPS
jgi:tetratricopeptide (TPR) repeat protein